MIPKSEHLVDLIFKKLKTYKNKKIFLEKEILNIIMYNFSPLTIVLIISFILSLYILLKVTSNSNN